jgi:thioredoxin 1
MLEITTDLEKINNGTNIVYFTATWCQPCKLLKPQFARAGTIDKENQYYIVDVDELSQEDLDRYKIMSVPQIWIIQDGDVTRRINGQTAEGMLDEIQDIIV